MKYRYRHNGFTICTIITSIANFTQSFLKEQKQTQHRQLISPMYRVSRGTRDLWNCNKRSYLCHAHFDTKSVEKMGVIFPFLYKKCSSLLLLCCCAVSEYSRLLIDSTYLVYLWSQVVTCYFLGKYLSRQPTYPTTLTKKVIFNLVI